MGVAADEVFGSTSSTMLPRFDRALLPRLPEPRHTADMTAALRARSMYEHTLIITTSDNGTHPAPFGCCFGLCSRGRGCWAGGPAAKRSSGMASNNCALSPPLSLLPISELPRGLLRAHLCVLVHQGLCAAGKSRQQLSILPAQTVADAKRIAGSIRKTNSEIVMLLRFLNSTVRQLNPKGITVCRL